MRMLRGDAFPVEEFSPHVVSLLIEGEVLG
jgi:hypothetical protein